MQLLLAWCGDAEVRDAMCAPSGHTVECFHGPLLIEDLSDAEWAAELPALAEAAVVRECEGKYCEGGTLPPMFCRVWGYALSDSQVIDVAASRCPACHGTGKVPLVSHPMMRLALAAARVALDEWESQGHWKGEENQCRCKKGIHFSGPACVRTTRPRRAVEAAEAWLSDPSDENRIAWRRAYVNATGYDLAPMWIPYPLTCNIVPAHAIPTLVDCVTAAVKIAGRQLIAEALATEARGWEVGA